MGIKASTASKTLSQLDGVSRLIQVGQRCGTNGQQGSPGSGAPYATSHQRILFPYGADAVQFIYAGWFESPNDYVAPNSGIGDPVLPPSMFQAFGVTYSGGTSYAVGDIDTFAVTSTTGIAAARVMITAVASGVPTQVQIIDGGLYNTTLASSVSPASTTGSGTGATATFTWKAGSCGLHVAIETTWGSLVAAGGGTGAVEALSSGQQTAFNNSLNWNMLIPIGDFLKSEIIPVDIPVGGAIGVRTSFGYNSPQLGRIAISSTTAPSVPSANYEAAFTASTFTDFSLSGNIGTTAGAGIMQPALVLGIPKVTGPSVIALGDSRCYGRCSGPGAINSFTPLDNDGNCGWFERALSFTQGLAYYPWANFSVGGSKLNSLFSSSFAGGSNSNLGGRYGRLRAIQMARPTAVYIGLNVNDLAAYSSGQVQAQEQALVAELRGMGVKYIFTDTTDPYTTSTDSFATVANQSYSTFTFNNLIARNVGLTNGTWAPYDFFIDQRSNVESSLNSGFWRANGTANYYTGDGLHPTLITTNLKAATAAAAIAANISV